MKESKIRLFGGEKKKNQIKKFEMLVYEGDANPGRASSSKCNENKSDMKKIED